MMFQIAKFFRIIMGVTEILSGLDVTRNAPPFVSFVIVLSHLAV
jgi:hypothetical protein